MEDFSYRYSPKVRDFASTQTTAFTSSPYNSACKLCPNNATYQKDDLTVTDLKREYSTALNCIEILKLEKKNLQDALTLTKDFRKDKTEKFFVSSTKSTAAPSPKGDFRPMKSLETERKAIELEQELLEQKRLVEKTLAQNEQLRQENYTYRLRLQEIDDLELRNHQLKSDLREMTDELQRETRRVYELEDENGQLLDRRAQLANSARKLPPKELYKYLDHVYELIGSFNRNHYANYHFRECFIDEENIETLIEDKETNELLLQSFRYITNLLVNINSSGAGSSVDQRRPSKTVLTDSESENQRRDNMTPQQNNFGTPSHAQYSAEAEDEGEEQGYPPNPMPNPNVSRNLNLNGISREVDVHQPHSFGDGGPLSHQDLSPQNRNQNSFTKVYSPSNSKNVASNNGYSNKANSEAISSRRDLSRNASYKSGLSVTSPNNRRDKSPSSKQDLNALNQSKQSVARSHVSQRTAHQNQDALNQSRHSQARSNVSHHTAHMNNADANALNQSRHSQAKSHVSRRTNHQNMETAAAGLNVSKQSVARSHVSHHTTHQPINNNAEMNALNQSRQSQARSHVSHQTPRLNNAEMNQLNQSRQSQARSHVSHHTPYLNNAEGEYYEGNTRNHINMNEDLEDRELRLRELDRELREKDRLLQMKEKELKDKSVMEKSMARYRAQQEEVDVNRSQVSQSRRLVSQKSLPKEKSMHASRQRIDESRENTRVLKSQTQLNERSQANLNKSTNSAVQSRIIPSITSLNDMDASPKGFGTTPKHTQNQIKSFTKIANSVQSLDPEFTRSPKAFSQVNSQKVLNVTSAYEANDTPASRLNPRIPYQEAYLSYESSPQSKISPKPQTLERLDSGIKLIDQGGRDEYDNNSQIYDRTPVHLASPKSESRRHITFDPRNLGDIEEIESSPQSKSMSRKMSIGESAKKGTEYASFRVSFGRTQSKYMRSQSPDVDAKDSLYIIDVARRKRVTHHEQTYDIVQGNEVKYDLQSMGPEYSVKKAKPRSKYELQSQSQSEHLDRSQPLISPRNENVPQQQ